MKFLDEYRDGDVCRQLIETIHATATRRWTLMEVCGGQTHGLLRFGIDDAIRDHVRLIHGPGCPVCVTPMEAIDRAIELARHPEVILTSFGDMMRVPGSRQSLLRARSEGCDVRLVYSPLDAVQLAEKCPDRKVIFFAVGFETTAPATAIAVQQAAARELRNFAILPAHVRVEPGMRLLASAPDRQLEGFLAAGHVCTVTGYQPYQELAEYHQVPIVVTGFEPADLLYGILQCVQLLEAGRAEVVNGYARSSDIAGNPAARRLLDDVFEACDQTWRGIGMIPGGGLQLRDCWRSWDASHLFGMPSWTESVGQETHSGTPMPGTPTSGTPMPGTPIPGTPMPGTPMPGTPMPGTPMPGTPIPGIPIIEHEGHGRQSLRCRSGEVLTGTLSPTDCEHFGRSCTPEYPLGAPMVSHEGACAAYFHYRPPIES